MLSSDDRSARQERYTIGRRAATVMKSQQVDVRAMRDLLDEQFRQEAQSGKPLPEVWLRDEKGHARSRPGQIHALRCWIPGTCHSSE